MELSKGGNGRVVVVGAGIVGVTCALALQRQGHEVVLIDRHQPGDACSFGNAGILTATECVPYALPGFLRCLPGWLLNPLGPLAVRPRHLPRMVKWGTRFARESAPHRVEKISRDMRAFYRSSVELYRELLASVGKSELLQTTGYLAVYRDEAASKEDAFAWDLTGRGGVLLETIRGNQLRDMVPALSPDLTYGVFVPEEGYVRNPHRVVRALAERFSADGGIILQREARGFQNADGRLTAVETDQESLHAGQVVLSAGAWSTRLASDLGARVLIESMRGYHFMLPDPEIELPMPILSGEFKFFATPMEHGLRLAGTAEFAGLDWPANYARADKLAKAAQTIFPGLRTAGGSRWMGHRPMTPDSMPIIGPSPRFPNAVLAFGHGHNGLSGAPITGRIVADLIAGRSPAIDLAPLSPTRFH
ncbi:FAD-dependent oxidoreductase [Mesorhizobium sp. M0938]|uniref:NAD(P)/FAD-dependent oxidoreductase n=1 Tax=unclassified Mesorhizobium TaxID=325217 RepID=UPI0033362C72